MGTGAENKLSKKLLKACVLMGKEYKRFLKNGDADLLHDYRVATRKLRSLLALSDQLYGVKADKMLREYLREVFTKSSSLRDIDTLLLFTEGLDGFKSKTLLKELKLEREARFEALSSEMSQKITKKTPLKCVQKTAELLGKCTQKSEQELDEFIKLSFAELKTQFADAISFQNMEPVYLHEFRKGCKKIRYQAEFSGDKEHLKLTELCKGVQDILGSVHDCIVWTTELTKVEFQKSAEDATALSKIIEKRKIELLKEYKAYIKKNKQYFVASQA